MYNLILMDYDTDKNKPPYTLLKQKELKLIPSKEIAADNSILLMWTIGP